MEWGVGLFGAAAVVLPLIWPRLAFWMVWGALLGVPAVVNYRQRGESLLLDLEAGRWARPVRIFVGGLWAGGMWEGMNYWARTKWVYTVPGFEEWKLFEMPLLGFVGFPFLALEAFAAYSLFSRWVRGGRWFERVDARQPGVSTGQWVTQALVLAGFSVAADAWPLDPAVMSRRPLLDELVDADVERLRDAGVQTPEQLVATELGSPLARQHAELALHKGMGAEHGRNVLEAVGPLERLVDADIDATLERLVSHAVEHEMSPPTRAQVGVWIRAARRGGTHRR